MLPRRFARTDGHSAFTDSERHLILAAETLRAGDTPPKRKDGGDRGDEKVSVFWRVFGGTILSITALSVITAYQNLAGGIHDVRQEVTHIREAGAEFIKKDEFNTRTTAIWNGIKDAQAVGPSVTVTANKVAALETQLTAAESERREFCREMLHLRERLAKLEGAQEAKPAVKPASHIEPSPPQSR